jgi:hypothetical protein
VLLPHSGHMVVPSIIVVDAKPRGNGRDGCFKKDIFDNSTLSTRYFIFPSSCETLQTLYDTRLTFPRTF